MRRQALLEHPAHRCLIPLTPRRLTFLLKYVNRILTYFSSTNPSREQHAFSGYPDGGQAMRPYGDNFILVVPVDYLVHTLDKPFCWDSTCGCHDDQTSISEVEQYVSNGLLTAAEATLFVLGRTV